MLVCCFTLNDSNDFKALVLLFFNLRPNPWAFLGWSGSPMVTSFIRLVEV